MVSVVVFREIGVRDPGCEKELKERRRETGHSLDSKATGVLLELSSAGARMCTSLFIPLRPYLVEWVV